MKIKRASVVCDFCTCLDLGYDIQISDVRHLLLCTDCAKKLYKGLQAIDSNGENGMSDLLVWVHFYNDDNPENRQKLVDFAEKMNYYHTEDGRDIMIRRGNANEVFRYLNSIGSSFCIEV